MRGWIRRGAVSVAGAVLLAAGAAMLVLPGPGLLVILAGLAVLATEYAWAHRLLTQMRERASQATRAVRERSRAARGPGTGHDARPARTAPAAGRNGTDAGGPSAGLHPDMLRPSHCGEEGARLP